MNKQNLLTKQLLWLLPFVLLSGNLLAQVNEGQAVRQLPYDFHPGDLIDVRLQVTPPVGTTIWSVREMYPKRWDFVSATNAASTNAFTGELSFGPFTNDVAMTLVYSVASVQELTNSGVFNGEVVFDGATNVITGTTVLPSRNEWLFIGPQALEQGTVSGVAYGAGKWVASSSGWVTTLESDGRLTYPRVPRYFKDGWSRLAYVGGLFLLFGAGDNGAQMMISEDGFSWKVAQDEDGDTHPDPFAQSGGYVQSVAYGNGVYVAVGEHAYPEESQFAGAIFRSTNGYNWKRVFRLVEPSRHINAVAFADNRFMAVGDQGTLLTSTDGSSWGKIQPIHVSGDSGGPESVWMSTSLRGIGYGPAGWIIPTLYTPGGASVPGTSLRSADGVNWDALTGTGSGAAICWESFYADGKYWFSGVGDAYTTEDGASWTRLPAPFSAHPVGPVGHAPDGVSPQYLGAGDPSASLVSSPNGADWVFASPGVNAVWPCYLSVATYRNEWVVSSQGDSQPGQGTMPSDSPGNIWIPVNAGALNVRSAGGQWRRGNTDKEYADLLTTTNGLLAAGVDRDAKLFANFLVGSDYVLGTGVALPYLHRLVPESSYSYKGLNGRNFGYQFAKASFAQTLDGFDLYAETYFPGQSFPSVMNWGHFTSTNGIDWALRANGLNNVTKFPGIRGLAWGAGRFVAVSEGWLPETAGSTTGPLISANRIYTSINGEDYVPVDLSALAPGLKGEGLSGVAYANGQFTAIGNSGSILSSTDGLVWKSVRTSDGHPWNRVRYLDGTWAAVGNAGWVAFSTDGQNWTSKTSGTESDLTDIGHQNGRYMTVGKNAMVLLSLPVVPVITTQPQSRTNLAGTLATFTIGATGDEPITYQWRKGGTNIADGAYFSGTATTTLSINGVTSGDAAKYDVVVTNAGGSVNSLVATLTVISPSVLVTGITATATSELASLGRIAAHAVDGVYYDTAFWESVGVNQGFGTDPSPAITFDLRQVWSLDSYVIWNGHELAPSIKRMVVETALDGIKFTALGEVTLSKIAPQSETNLLNGVLARYVRFNILENGAGQVFPVVGDPTAWSLVAIDEVEFHGKLATVAPTQIVLQSPAFTPGMFRFDIFSAAGVTFDVERALSLTGPWINVGSVLIGSGGSGVFEDNSPPTGAGYYRAVLR